LVQLSPRASSALSTLLFAPCRKKQEARSLLTGLWVGGIRLKDRSAGGWRSGLQRSEKWWRRGHVPFRASHARLQHLPCHAGGGRGPRAKSERVMSDGDE